MIDSPNAMLGDPLLEELVRTTDARRLEAMLQPIPPTSAPSDRCSGGSAIRLFRTTAMSRTQYAVRLAHSA
jgi:hypothetical protein